MNSQYTVIEDLFDETQTPDPRQQAYQSELQIKKQNVLREKEALYDKSKHNEHITTSPIYSMRPEKKNHFNSSRLMSCNEFYEHYLQCDFCRSFVERNEKFYQFVIFVLAIVIAILLRQSMK